MPATIYYEGAVCRFSTNPALSVAAIPFTSITGTVVDPDVVTFAYSVTNGVGVSEWTVFTWTNGSGDPSNTIVHDTTGCFHADIDTSGKSGFWAYRWTCHPSGAVNIDTTKTQAAFIGEFQVAATS